MKEINYGVTSRIYEKDGTQSYIAFLKTSNLFDFWPWNTIVLDFKLREFVLDTYRALDNEEAPVGYSKHVYKDSGTYTIETLPDGCYDAKDFFIVKKNGEVFTGVKK